jgi:hypothetical protein
MFLPLLLITSCDSSKYFARLRNLVGSAQYWEPELQVVVYDLGLSDAHRSEVESWSNVKTVVAVPFGELPAHVRELRQFAWKPWVMRDALRRFAGTAILYQDAGQELRRPIDEVRALLERDGHFFVAQDGASTQLRCCGRIGELTHSGTLDALGANDESTRSATMCAGGIQGYAGEHVDAVKRVLEPTLACAMDAACIAPAGATLANHRFDQSVFSIHLHRANIRCQTDARFWANRGNMRSAGAINGITEDHRSTNDAILFSRRGWGFDYDQAGRGAAVPAYAQYLKFKHNEL